VAFGEWFFKRGLLYLNIAIIEEMILFEFFRRRNDWLA
jgi:hypothetical protein